MGREGWYRGQAAMTYLPFARRSTWTVVGTRWTGSHSCVPDWRSRQPCESSTDLSIIEPLSIDACWDNTRLLLRLSCHGDESTCNGHRLRGYLVVRHQFVTVQTRDEVKLRRQARGRAKGVKTPTSAAPP